MSNDWVKDIRLMHDHYGLREKTQELSIDKLRKYLKFRANFIGEEYHELQTSLEDPEEVVDALIDICVVAIGTLDLYGVDAGKAWDEVLRTNMNKKVGVKENRPNPLGLPDLMKPEGWTPPSHEGNHGLLANFVCDGCTQHGTKVVTIDKPYGIVYKVHCDSCGRLLNGIDVLVKTEI